MKNSSPIYSSKLSFTQPGYKSLANSSINYLQQDKLTKKISQSTIEKHAFDYLSHSQSKAYLKNQINLNKRMSIDFMKKSIHPVQKYLTQSNQQKVQLANFKESLPFNYILKDSNNKNFSSKPCSSRNSLNISNLSSLKATKSSRNSYNYQVQSNEAGKSSQNKTFFLDKIKQKSPLRKNIHQKQNISKSSHTRQASSYGFCSQSQMRSTSKDKSISKVQSKLCSRKKQIQFTEDLNHQMNINLVEPIQLIGSQVNIDVSSEDEIQEPTQMTARFNFTEDRKISSQNKCNQILISHKSNQQLTTSLDNKLNKQPNKIINLSNFLLGPCKGKGRYGKVYLAIERATGVIYALKQISLLVIKSMFTQFINQLKIQSFLHHPYITKVYGYFVQNQNIYLIMEYMTEGNLYEKIKKRGPISQLKAATKLHQISQGLNYMHSYNIIHRDLKPENIVISFDVCKICDFSWSVKCNERRQTNCGTLDYLSPEMIQGHGYSSSIDLWAMGVLLYEMLIGKPPFYNISVKQTAKRIKQCQFVLPDILSSSSKQLIQCFLRKDPQQRKQMDQILRHKFFEKIQE